MWKMLESWLDSRDREMTRGEVIVEEGRSDHQGEQNGSGRNTVRTGRFSQQVIFCVDSSTSVRLEAPKQCQSVDEVRAAV